jgi:hypothetical protein
MYKNLVYSKRISIFRKFLHMPSQLLNVGCLATRHASAVGNFNVMSQNAWNIQDTSP